ncbi:uncharacterized protein E0L32_011100 [Thyridium curvatum]|uniref:Sulfite efflux pump SSU1 n=1 Tax=Thyridium curvatum TaxID=1093900 RepID=A0A507ADA2_9PEZI|nr:uncharacterized protein E0L32_011100 [Thyridium curvatum]TPX06955.1 hypothetical protein E0L32_011100 [Thyridium curvatum]
MASPGNPSFESEGAETDVDICTSDLGAGADNLAPTGQPCKENTGWRRIVRNFTPSWFSVNMGTGIVSVLLHNLPYNAYWIQVISYIFFALNIVLFTVFFAITVARYLLYPEIFVVMLKHPAQSLFLGCLPMGFATIVNMIVFVCAPWGDAFIYLAWGLWWVDAAVSAICCLTIPFVAAHHHRRQLDQITAALLLPVVPVIVASASGGIVAEVLPNASHAVTTVVVSYVLMGLGQFFSFYILAIYLLRLQVHDLPPREVLVSVFLPVGPLGQGGFGIQQLGKVCLELFPRAQALGAVGVDPMRGGEVAYVLGVVGALCMWGAALGWLTFALISIFSIKRFPFNMGWWGFTFPLGVFTTCTGLMAEELSSGFLRVLTTAASGEMFNAPCLKDLRPKEQQGGCDRTA